MSKTKETASWKVVLLGMDSEFSRTVFYDLFRDKLFDLKALVVPRPEIPGASMPMGFPSIHVPGSQKIVDDARRLGVRVLVARNGEKLELDLQSIAPDFLLVACFPSRIESRVADTARLACLNLHPSLLPRYRGPDPIFWQLRYGERETGVTLHYVCGCLDAGDIVAQRSVPLSLGATRVHIDRQFGHAGTELFAQRVTDWLSLKPKRQRDSLSTHQGFPDTADFQVPVEWPVVRAFNFLRGADRHQRVFEIRDGDQTIQIRQALRYETHVTLNSFLESVDDGFMVRFSDGVLTVQ